MSDFTSFCVAYEQTNFFSKLVIDYINQSDNLTPFYAHQPSIEGIKESIKARNKFNTPRQLLVEVLNEQYAGLPVSEKLRTNLELLLEQNTFTITTAHQPNIFTGPLYFIYKILHTAKLANELSKQLPDYKFVPVYYMGSEDADLDELGQINIGGQKLVWQTKQTGAVGRMKVDKDFLKLINAIEGQIGVLPEGLSLTNLFRQVYLEGKMIQQATLELVNILFADYGIVVLIPDNAKLKTAYELVVKMNGIAGEHGVGRLDIMEDRMLGLKVRENYECPAAVALLTAHKALEALVCTQGELRFKASVDREWGEIAYKGLWLDPLKEDLEAFINKIQERVTGTVNLRLAKGSAVVIGRESEFALYNADLASFDSKTFNQSESLGAVKAHGMQSRQYFHLKYKGNLALSGASALPLLGKKAE